MTRTRRRVKPVKASIRAKSFRSFGPKRAPRAGDQKNQELHAVKSSRARTSRLRIRSVKHSAAVAGN